MDWLVIVVVILVIDSVYCSNRIASLYQKFDEEIGRFSPKLTELRQEIDRLETKIRNLEKNKPTSTLPNKKRGLSLRGRYDD